MGLFYVLLFLSICTYPIPAIRIGGQPIALFLSIYALIFFVIQGYVRKVNRRTLWPIGLLLLGFLISSFASGSINTNFLINLIAFYVIFFVMANTECNQKKAICQLQKKNVITFDAILRILVFSGVVLGCYGYYGYITGKVGTDSQYFWWTSARYWGIHYTESTRNADVHYIAFPFIAILAKEQKNFKDVLMLLFFGVAMILSMARNTWLCIFVVLLVYLFLQDDVNKKLKYMATALLAIAIGYFALSYFNMTDYFVGKVLSIFSMHRTSTVSNSNSERFNVILTTIKIIVDHPLGVGAEGLPLYYRNEGFKLNHAENTYLNIMAEMGLISLIAYASIVWTPITSMLREKKLGKLNERECFVLLAALYFALTIFFNTETINCYMWIVLGIIWYERRTSLEERMAKECIQ